MKFIIYKHTSPNRKVYIGITKRNPEERWNDGKGYIGNKYFTNAINKYGWDNFTHEILFENLSKEEACQKEIELIAEYNSNNPEFGYNITAGGEGRLDSKQSEETKNKISEASKQHWQDPIIREKIKIGIQNATYPENFGKHISEGLRKYYSTHTFSEVTKQKISKANKGNIAWNRGLSTGISHPVSEETRQKISNANKGKIITDKQKEKISKARKGVFKHTEESKEKLRQIALNMSEEQKQKISNGVKQAWKDGKYDNVLFNGNNIFKKGHIPWNKGLTKDDPRVLAYTRKIGEWHPGEETRLKMSLAKKGKKPVNCKKIVCVETNEIFNSIAEASRIKNISNIGKALTNNIYTAGGYHWNYYKEE